MVRSTLETDGWPAKSAFGQNSARSPVPDALCYRDGWMMALRAGTVMATDQVSERASVMAVTEDA